jgi:hypothetical protein
VQQNDNPPHPVARIYGYHQESRKESDGKKKKVKVDNFDIKLNLTQTI